MNNLGLWLAKRNFNNKRVEVYESIANAMLKDGVPLRAYVQKLAQRASGDKDSAALVYNTWLRGLGSVETRGQFAECVKTTVPQMDYTVLSGFEKAGKLPEGILYLSQIIHKIKKIKSDFISNLIRPAISILVAFLLAAFFGSIASDFLSIAAEDQWSGTALAMFKFTTFINENFLFLAIAFISIVTWFLWSVNNWGKYNVQLRHKLDQFMPYSMFKDVSSFITLIMLGALLASGMPLKVSVQTIMSTGSKWLASYFRIILRKMGSVESKEPVRSFDVGFFPKDIYYRLLDSSERGDFHTAVKRIAEDAFISAEKKMKKSAFLLDQLSWLIAGGIIMFIAAGLVSAVADLQSIASASME